MVPSITVFAALQIEQLQLHLQQEKSMRIMLDRAMGRASSTLSPGHRHFAAQVTFPMIYTSNSKELFLNFFKIYMTLSLEILPNLC
jgi:hypothetical protein